MEGMWRKAKKALGAGLCVRLPAVAGDWEDGVSERRASDALSQDASSAAATAAHLSAPNTPAAALPGAPLRRSKSGTKSAKVRLFSFSPSSSHCELYNLCLGLYPW